MSGHTPGPLGWVHSMTTTANGGFHCYLTDADGRKIAALWGKEAEKVANAHLFAAAPALLEALVALVDSFEKHRPKELWDNARAAIAAATGDGS